MSEDLFDMFANLKGLPAEEAKKLLPVSFLVRVTEKDSPMTAEYLPDRLNLITNNGVVEEVFWG